MDSGFLAAGETLNSDYDVLEPPSLQETIGIIDQMLCHEVRSGRYPFASLPEKRLYIKSSRYRYLIAQTSQGYKLLGKSQ